MAPRKQQKPAVGKQHVKLSLSSEAATRLQFVATMDDASTMSSIVEALIMADKKKDAAFATSLGQLRAQLKGREDQITAFEVDQEIHQKAMTDLPGDLEKADARILELIETRDSLLKENEQLLKENEQHQKDMTALVAQIDDLQDRLEKTRLNRDGFIVPVGVRLRKRFADGESMAELAAAFGLTIPWVEHVVRGKI